MVVVVAVDFVWLNCDVSIDDANQRGRWRLNHGAVERRQESIKGDCCLFTHDYLILKKNTFGALIISCEHLNSLIVIFIAKSDVQFTLICLKKWVETVQTSCV